MTKSSHVRNAGELLNISKVYADMVKVIVAKRKSPVQNLSISTLKIHLN